MSHTLKHCNLCWRFHTISSFQLLFLQGMRLSSFDLKESWLNVPNWIERFSLMKLLFCPKIRFAVFRKWLQGLAPTMLILENDIYSVLKRGARLRKRCCHQEFVQDVVGNWFSEKANLVASMAVAIFLNAGIRWKIYGISLEVLMDNLFDAHVKETLHEHFFIGFRGIHTLYFVYLRELKERSKALKSWSYNER